jgi:hypothetical protein
MVDKPTVGRIVFSPSLDDAAKASRQMGLTMKDCTFDNGPAAELAALRAENAKLNAMRAHCERCGADYLATGVEAGCPCILRAQRDEAFKAGRIIVEDCDRIVNEARARVAKLEDHIARCANLPPEHWRAILSERVAELEELIRAMIDAEARGVIMSTLGNGSWNVLQRMKAAVRATESAGTALRQEEGR